MRFASSVCKNWDDISNTGSMHQILTHGQRRYPNGRRAPCQQGKELESTSDAEVSKALRPKVSGLRRRSSAVYLIKQLARALSINDAGSQQSPAWHHLQVPRPPIRPVSHVTDMYPARGRQRKVPLLLSSSSHLGLPALLLKCSSNHK